MFAQIHLLFQFVAIHLIALLLRQPVGHGFKFALSVFSISKIEVPLMGNTTSISVLPQSCTSFNFIS